VAATDPTDGRDKDLKSTVVIAIVGKCKSQSQAQSRQIPKKWFSVSSL